MRRVCSLMAVSLAIAAIAGTLRSAETSTPARPASLSSSASLPATSPAKSLLPKTSSNATEQTAYINDFIRQGWQAHNLHPSPAATDGEWCRRLYLDLLGRIPTVDELEQYLRDHSTEKKAKLVNRLLSDQYVEEYAQNWSNLWTTILIGRPPAGNDRSLVDRDGLQKYLRDSFARNKPYDHMVRELLTATGANKPGEDDFRGETNFLIGNMDADRKGLWINATAKTAKVFLGLQVQCTQCHNHPFNDWKQNQFWELNAFFRQTGTRAEGAGKPRERTTDLMNRDFPGEANGPERNPSQAIVFYELRNGQLKSAFPVFVDGEEIDPNGRLSIVNRREELAKFVTTSAYLNQAIVNRMWGHFLGYGFTKPVDDMGPHNPPSHPELLAKLADDFASHSHDLKQLIRWIVLSEPYGLSSKIVKGRNEKDDPSKGEKPMFSHFYMRQMQPEELFDSLLVATSADKTFHTSEEQERMKTQWLRQFTITFGTDDGDDSTTFNGTIPQTLMMFNGEMIRRATSTEAGGFLDRLVKDPKPGDPVGINRLFMATLARKPDKAELDWANKLLAARRLDTTSTLQDVFWVVLNTGEFILNH